MKSETNKKELEQNIERALQTSKVDEDLLNDQELSQTEGGANGICFNFRKGCGASDKVDQLDKADGVDEVK